MIRRAVLLVVMVLAVAWPIAAHAQAAGTGPKPADQVMLSGDVFVPRGTVVGEVVVFSGSATIEGVAQGDVVVLDGPVTVAGQVGGDVVAIHGPIRLLATAQVTGDVLAGGNLTVVDGAQVQGTVRRDVRFTFSGAAALGALLASLAVAVSVLVAALVLLLLAPRGLERTAEAGRGAPWASAGWGVLSAIGVPILAVALAATVLGLPIGLALLLGLGLLWLVGIAVASFVLGRLVVKGSRVGALFAGWGIGAAVGLVPFLGIVWWGLGAMFGLGTVVVASWRARTGPRPPVPGGRSGRHRAGQGQTTQTTQAAPAVEEPAADAPLAED